MTEGIDVDIPAAWHPDPLGRYEYRYWDGQRWTEHVANQGVAGVDATGLEPPAAAQQTGSWDPTAEQQPAGGQPVTGWQQGAAQEPQQPAAGPASEPSPEPATGATDPGGRAPSADDADHWQQPWTASAAVPAGPADGSGAVGDAAPAGDTPTAGSAEPSAPVAGQDGDPTHWQRPWTQEPTAATAPVAASEHAGEHGAGLQAEPAAAPEPAATAAPWDEAEPVEQGQPATGDAPAEEALPHWQQPWEASTPEAAAVHEAPAGTAPPWEAEAEAPSEAEAEAEPQTEPEPDWGTQPWSAAPGQDGPDEDAPGVAGPGAGAASEDTGLAPAPTTVEEANEADRATAAEELSSQEESAHDAPADTPREASTDERPHWQQPWTSSTPSA